MATSKATTKKEKLTAFASTVSIRGKNGTSRPRPEVYRFGFRVTVPEGNRLDGSLSGRHRAVALIFDPENPSDSTMANDFASYYAKVKGIDRQTLIVRR
jgi:hypothetical protein